MNAVKKTTSNVFCMSRNDTNCWDTESFINWTTNGCNINDASKVDTLEITYFGNDLHEAGLFKHFVNLRILDLSSCHLLFVIAYAKYHQKLKILQN